MSNSTFNLKTPRVEVVDALRGFAIMSIMLLHNIEHFDYYYFPEALPEWMKVLDKIIWETLFFLFGGKSYAIFALLFGFSFYIQNDNQEKKGKDFRGRFLWRLFLLLGFGLLNAIFYEGDILMIYAVLGLTLIPVCKWNDKTVFFTAVILMLQPLEWTKFFYMLLHPEYVPTPNLSDHYFGMMGEYLKSNSFMDYAIGNLNIGRFASVAWSWENGRFFQAPSLFMLGMLVGRRKLFIASTESNLFWKKALQYAIFLFVPLFALKTFLPELIERKATMNSVLIIITSWSNLAFMIVMVSTFILIYQKESIHNFLSKLIPFGKMSLTNYIMQSIVGSFIYYRYGLGLVEYTGATYCLLIGIVLFILQISFCTWWLKTHKQGPLEYIWHKATWISFRKKRNNFSGVAMNKS
ncbi:hypothetical protein DOS84_12720 [Flavobacterium aquariorum]|uniref:DUF418 domain-containing protein n=1 Tax=Flavobacterium aquariorum TaxID=2217670 RepID=A0A2W7UDD9_9FLAO|nr:DUF418 domain-containing protein [Flavobacterium aquariorum]PZX93207.1 hypothetical protein DOS84_12720 [Flavobacterium aquariorum]